MRDDRGRQRAVLGAVGAVLVAAVAGLAYLAGWGATPPRGSGPSGPPDPARTTPAAPSRTAAAGGATAPGPRRPGGPGSRSQVPAPAPVPAAGEGRERPDLGQALTDLRAALRANDIDRIGWAETRLRAYIAGDEGKAIELLELLKRESDPAFLSVLAGVLASETAATGSLTIVAAMAAIAEDRSAPAARREQALAFLAAATAPVDGLDQRLQALAREEDPVLRQGALGAMANRAQGLPPERAAAATAAFVRAVQAERDPDMRASFLAGVPLRDAAAETVGDVAAALRSDASAAVREAAAHALGDVPASQRGEVVAGLEGAFRAEADASARRAMLISIVRLLGPGAQAAFERMRASAGTSQADVDDYLAILRSGETQADRIFEQKVAREQARGVTPDDHQGHHD